MPTYERMIVFRLGRIRTPQGPGMVLLLPFIDSFQRVDLRTRAFNVPPCKVRIFLAPPGQREWGGGLCGVMVGSSTLVYE